MKSNSYISHHEINREADFKVKPLISDTFKAMKEEKF
jgi:hypothetical protein